MGDRDHGAVCKGFLNQSLDLLFRFYVDVAGGFVQDYYPVSAQDGAADAKQLLFATAQVFAVFFDVQVKR
jgi:hypothetical protein